MTRQTAFFPLQGGLNLVTPAIMTPSGHAIAAQNYESHPRGYRRVDGFERLDGRPRPSRASYWVLPFQLGSAEVSEDQIVSGATSGATGRALFNGVQEGGDYGVGDAFGYLVLMTVTGTFEAGEQIQVGGVSVATASAPSLGRGAQNDEDDQDWHIRSIEKTRADIEQVPGSGPVRGVWIFDGEIYAFRDKADASAGVMHKATPNGWQPVDLGTSLAFKEGTAKFEEGETVTGATSGASATIRRVVTESGDFTNDDAAGRLILGNVTGGTFQAGEALSSASGAAKAVGTDEAITLPPGGRYDFVNHNFYADEGMAAMYGVNGEGRAFEFDGEVFVPLHTSMYDDRPIHVTVHRNHLFLAFRGGMVQHSSIGDPYRYEVITGALEFGIGEPVTGLLGSVAGALVIFGRNKVAVLVGDDSENWVLNSLSDESGAFPWTAQRIGTPVYLDDRGLRSMETTDAFGDFNIGTLSQMVEPLFQQKTRAGASVVGSLRVRAKDTYRLFWDDGTGISLYFGRQPAEVMPFNLGFVVNCLASGEDSEGRERLLAGSVDGWVYELDSGTSFDGEEVNGYLRLPFNHVGSPSHKKRWLKAVLEVDSGPRTVLGVVPEFTYGSPDQPPGRELVAEAHGSGGFWNEMEWDRFYWSAPTEGQMECQIDGMGTNISIAVASNSINDQPHVLHGMLLHYTARGIAR